MYIVFYSKATGNITHKEVDTAAAAQRALLGLGFIVDNISGVWHSDKYFARIRTDLPPRR